MTPDSVVCWRWCLHPKRSSLRIDVMCGGLCLPQWKPGDRDRNPGGGTKRMKNFWPSSRSPARLAVQFTVASTVRRFFVAKLRNSAKSRANRHQGTSAARDGQFGVLLKLRSDRRGQPATRFDHSGGLILFRTSMTSAKNFLSFD